MMLLTLSEEDRRFRDEVRAFLSDRLTADIIDRTRLTPGIITEPDLTRDWQSRLAEKGWAAALWPAADGGPGWTPLQRYIFDKECADAGAPVLPLLSLKLIGPVISHFGTPEQKARFLPRIISGEDYWCQGYSEPGAGSDLASLTTSARLEGDEYVVNGSKIWATHAHHANWIFALVRTSAIGKKQAGISFLLLPMDQPGITVMPIHTIGNDHEVNQIFFDNARTPAVNLIGVEGQGWDIAKFLLENERGSSFISPNLLADIRRLKQHHASRQRGNALSDRLTRLELEACALEVIELRIVDELMRGSAPGPQTSLIKMVGSYLRQDVDELAMDLAGYDGLQLPRERPLYGDAAPRPLSDADSQVAAARYLNARAWSIFGGSNEIQKTIIAKTVLGL
jgi:alkylation response protein AidB-like acyl-CoA dehydrogenase